MGVCDSFWGWRQGRIFGVRVLGGVWELQGILGVQIVVRGGRGNCRQMLGIEKTAAQLYQLLCIWLFLSDNV